MRFGLRTILIAALILPAVAAWAYLAAFPPPIPVVVATSDLEPWSQLANENTDTELWPSRIASSDFVRDANEVTGKYLKHRVSRGMPISKAHYGTLEEIVDFLTTRPKHGSNIMTVDCVSDGDILGLGPMAGDRVRLSVFIDGAERIIANNVLVARDYQPTADTPQNVYWSIGVELNDDQSIDYLKSKGEGEIRAYLNFDGG